MITEPTAATAPWNFRAMAFFSIFLLGSMVSCSQHTILVMIKYVAVLMAIFFKFWLKLILHTHLSAKYFLSVLSRAPVSMGAVGALAPTGFESVGASTHDFWYKSINFHEKLY